MNFHTSPAPLLSRLSFFSKSLAGAISLSAIAHLHADVTMPPIFGDHMVLQSGVPLTVWGWAEPGEKVNVQIAGVTATGEADKDRKWRIKLSPLPENSQPTTMTIRGKNTVVLSDVLVGDVWLCSGQSNMEFGLGATSLKGIKLQDEPQIRLFTVPRSIRPYPSEGEMAPPTPESPLSGKWLVATVDNAMKGGQWQGFSAVGYYFGNFIHAKTKMPVGMIASVWGGTPAQPWISLEGLQSDPRLKGEADSVPRYRASYEQNLKKYDEEMKKWKVEVAEWEKKAGYPLNEYARHVKDWGHEADKLKAAGQPVPPRPEQPPREPRDFANNNQVSSALFNGMIAPLIPYAIKGALWYQGESSASQPLHYQALLPALIADWRKKWGVGDFPFFIVQLPNFIQGGQQPIMPPDSPSVWAAMREAQKNIAAAVSNTDLAVTIDLAAIKVSLHPWDKWDVAERLSLLARKKVYGEPNLVAHGPVYKSQTVEGNKVRITFEPDSIGGGLSLDNPPLHLYYAVELPRPSTPPQDLTGFVIRRSGQSFRGSQSLHRQDNTVVVSSEKVANPVSVRYDWADNPHGDLYNKEGLPAGPFRTDAIPLGTK
ncbi:protein of unknown function DUF303 acetylesterase putative [Chthoniobacter flavus Ellin428]|uniref:Sialate O-acetylesterase domain-containing protein n=1 Tax=Chthoniobacter flavus Ellin428 TaxID=497964 RepID=B4D7G6_9BACT|nr:protein of unknown function DUF303 acetylesterase putative [Chthoniobacter flavus Ellin428]